MKYVIDIDTEQPFVNGLGVHLYTSNSRARFSQREIDFLEPLTAEYVNEHFGDLQDEAYQKGLDDAWELARKIYVDFSIVDVRKAFGETAEFSEILSTMTVNEALAKLKAYEEKKDDTIRVGDEVKQNGDKGVCVKIYNDTIRVMWADGSSCRWKLSSDLQKTGKHFDIESILEALKE